MYIVFNDTRLEPVPWKLLFGLEVFDKLITGSAKSCVLA